MVAIHRYVQHTESKKGATSKQPLAELREIPAWILLAEPGAGKTHVFKSETKNSPEDTYYLSVREFLHDDDENWRGKCLFLDGLDEVRADQAEGSIPTRIASKLKKYGIQRFRLSCRAAAWNGNTDRDDLSKTDAGSPEVFTLCPLEEQDDQTQILTEEGLSDSATWLTQAQDAGLSHWLGNPQMLRLLAKTELPISKLRELNKRDIYKYACDAYIEEQNKRHRATNKNATATPEEKHAAAGYLSTMMLLTNATDISLDTDKGSITGINTYAPPHANAARQALGSALFVPSMVEECVSYRHRTIAEYLAGWWLAGQITHAGLPLGRVLSILTGFDQKPIAGLQGLYAWLACHLENTNQVRLINADPMSVILYGDANSLHAGAQKALFHACQKEAHNNPTAFRLLRGNLAPKIVLAPLWCEALQNDILETLQSKDTTAGHIAFVEGLLDALQKATTLPVPRVTQLGYLVTQTTLTSDGRTTALQVWLKHVSAEAAKDMLNGLHNGTSEDPNGDLVGTLLCHLYPTSLTTQEVAVYLDPNRLHGLRFGMYLYFWHTVFTEAVSDQDLSDFLDILVKRFTPLSGDADQLCALVHPWIAKSMSVVPDGKRLLSWLLIGFDENKSAPTILSTVKEWLSTHPEQYKDLLDAIYSQYEHTEKPKDAIVVRVSAFLSGVERPNDIGLWHFQHIEKRSNPDIARYHFDESMQALYENRGNAGLTYAMVETWAQTKPDYQTWLANAVFCPIESLQVTLARINRLHQDAETQRKQEKRNNILPHLSTLKTGEGPLPILHHLADLWLRWFSDVPGETPEERYQNSFDDYSDIYEAAKQGFEACLHRGDLPSVKDIVALYCDGKHHWRMWPCLAGIALYWEKHPTPTCYKTLSTDTKAALIAFRVMAPLLGPDPDWFIALKEHSPESIAKVFLAYLRQCLKSKKNERPIAIPYIHDALQRLENKPIALLVIPKALQAFPSRANATQLETLSVLLKLAWHYTPDTCAAIVAKRLHKSLDPKQHLYLLATGLLCAPDLYETPLWTFVADNWTRIQQLSTFLSHVLNETSQTASTWDRVPVHTLGKLIEGHTPHARLDWPTGGFEMSPDIAWGDTLRGYIDLLGNNTSPTALTEIQRLLAQPELSPIKPYLERSLAQVTQSQREKTFAYPDTTALASLLKNEAPASSRDLYELILAHLEDIQHNIQTGSHNPYEQFWKPNPKDVKEFFKSNPKPNKDELKKLYKDENTCRNALLGLLHTRVPTQKISFDKEKPTAHDTRCDIWVSSGAYQIPIEIKGEWNEHLWTSPVNQLIPYIQNSRAHNALGYGIYLILWFGGTLQPQPKDGKTKPTSPKELKERMEAYLKEQTATSREQIRVVVLDVSWPNT